jgi:hypothetical protein
VLSMRCCHLAQPVEHVRRLPEDAGGHHRGHPEAGRHLLLQVLRKVSLQLWLLSLHLCKMSFLSRKFCYVQLTFSKPHLFRYKFWLFRKHTGYYPVFRTSVLQGSVSQCVFRVLGSAYCFLQYHQFWWTFLNS